MQIAGRDISYAVPPAFVAEISCNHCGSIEKAALLVEHAVQAKADFIKFQCYEPDAMTLPGFMIEQGPWKGRDLYDLYAQAQTPYGWFPELAQFCRKAGIPWFASVFDHGGLEVLEYAGTCAYKIASCEIQDTELIRAAADTGKPVIVSTGLASRSDVARALDVLSRHSAHNPVLLHCIAGYPSKPREAQLATLEVLKGMTPLVGLSDHSTHAGHPVPIAATTLGVVMIEKHLRLSFNMGRDGEEAMKSLDAQHSINRDQFYTMVQTCNEIWLANETLAMRIDVGITGSEKETEFARRSLRAKTDIPAGAPLTPENVAALRPGGGLPPYEYETIIGKIAVDPIPKGAPITWERLGEDK